MYIQPLAFKLSFGSCILHDLGKRSTKLLWQWFRAKSKWLIVNYLGAAAHHVQDRRFYSWDVAIALFKVNPKECFLSKNDNLLTQVQICTLFFSSFLNFHQSKEQEVLSKKEALRK